MLAGGCRDEHAPSSGKVAPTIKLPTLQHDRFYLNDHRGKPVVLVFWHTTCQVCKREMVQLDALRRALGPERVTMAGVLNDPENLDVARQIIGALGLGFPTLLDQDGKVSESYGVQDFPTTVVITPDGKIGLSRVGYTEPLIQQVKSTLEGYR